MYISSSPLQLILELIKCFLSDFFSSHYTSIREKYWQPMIIEQLDWLGIAVKTFFLSQPFLPLKPAYRKKKISYLHDTASMKLRYSMQVQKSSRIFLELQNFLIEYFQYNALKNYRNVNLSLPRTKTSLTGTLHN